MIAVEDVLQSVSWCPILKNDIPLCIRYYLVFFAYQDYLTTNAFGSPDFSTYCSQVFLKRFVFKNFPLIFQVLL
jgi:hypothetical protein